MCDASSPANSSFFFFCDSSHYDCHNELINLRKRLGEELACRCVAKTVDAGTAGLACVLRGLIGRSGETAEGGPPSGTLKKGAPADGDGDGVASRIALE